MEQKNAVYNMGSERGTGFRPEEIFYYLFFAIMLFAKGIGLYEGMKSFRLCIIAAFFCFVVKVCLTEHTVGELVQMLVLMAFGVLAYRNSGEMAAFIYVLVIAGMKHVPVKRVFKVGAAVWTGGIFFHYCIGFVKADTGSRACPFQIRFRTYYQMEPWVSTSQCAPYFLCYPSGFLFLSRKPEQETVDNCNSIIIWG